MSQTLISCWLAFFQPIMGILSSGDASTLTSCWYSKLKSKIDFMLAGIFSPNQRHIFIRRINMRPHCGCVDVVFWFRTLISCMLAVFQPIIDIVSSGAASIFPLFWYRKLMSNINFILAGIFFQKILGTVSSVAPCSVYNAVGLMWDVDVEHLLQAG